MNNAGVLAQLFSLWRNERDQFEAENTNSEDRVLLRIPDGSHFVAEAQPE